MVTTAQIDSMRLRKVFGIYPTGVAVLAARVDGTPQGLGASSFTSVSLDPPLVSVCIAHTSTTWPKLRIANRIGVSVLSGDQEQAGRQLTSKSIDRFAGLTWRETADGALLLEGASAWLDVSIHRHIEAGDHDIVILGVHDLGGDHGVHPLVFHASQFRKLAG